MAIISRGFAGRRSGAETKLPPVNTSLQIFLCCPQDQHHTLISIVGNLR